VDCNKDPLLFGLIDNIHLGDASFYIGALFDVAGRKGIDWTAMKIHY
jgi:hypothetical protein